MCFIARPSDQEFQMEEDILRQLLTERNYETFVALQNIDPGKLAFCTKICSKIITSHFCIVILNKSKHADIPNVKIPNPNVHLEYGMMLSFHKHVIPIHKEAETLPFNIHPLDTIKYGPGNFKQKVEAAIDDAILRFSTKEPPGRPIGATSDVMKYFSFSGMRYSDITEEWARSIFPLGQMHGFNLFDGIKGIIFFGYFHDEEPREIVIRVKFLLTNIDLSYRRLDALPDDPRRDYAYTILDQISIEVLVSEDAPQSVMTEKITEFRREIRNVPVQLHRPSDIERLVRQEYESIGF